jgi:RNA recognition motif-containing protein
MANSTIRRRNDMADTTVFFGNVAFRAEDDDLRRLVETVAPVKSCRIITDKMSGASKGFAFVELQAAQDIEKVILELNGRDLWGRALRVARGRSNWTH